MKQMLLLMAVLALLSTSCTKHSATSAPSENPCELSDEELAYRLACDFTASRQDVTAYIRKYIPDVTDEQINDWTRRQVLENMLIDGEVRYFCRTASNLFRVDSACRAIKEKMEGQDLTKESGAFAIKEQNVVDIENGNNAPKKVRICYTLTVKADVVPAGDTIRCWLPFPRRDVQRQTDVALLSSFPESYILAPVEAPHSTLYLEQVAVAGEPTVFREEFTYTGYGFRLGDTMLSTLNPEDYLREQIPHIVFSDRLRSLADSLTEGCATDKEKALAIFRHIDRVIPWAGAREYSTIPNIPEYVLDRRHGDCGQQTLLFMTLCRICGIPAHFQSGWYVSPLYDNLHDWCEIWLQDYGWVPVDQSHGIMRFSAFCDQERCFYLGSMDAFRLIVNNTISAPLVPEKWYPRSETVDFQRGEVEYRGGNLYFPDWTYSLTSTW